MNGDKSLTDKRHLSSLKRGLAALSILNLEDRLTPTQLSRRLGVPRTTAHRILQTLVAEGYVIHDGASRSYHLGSEVRRLAQGFNRDSLVAEVARPALRALCAQLLTPVGLAAPRGHDIVIQVSMDYEAPLALNRLPEGTAFPVTYGPSGHLFLAHCDPDLRRQIVAGAALSPAARRPSPPRPPGDAELRRIRRRGYALSVSRDANIAEGVLATPIYLDGTFIASIHLRFMKRVVSPASAVERYLQPLLASARQIEQTLSSVLKAAPELYGAIQRPLLAPAGFILPPDA